MQQEEEEDVVKSMKRESDLIRYEISLNYAIIKNIAKKYAKCKQSLSSRDVVSLKASLQKIQDLTSKLNCKEHMSKALNRLESHRFKLQAEQQFMRHVTRELTKMRQKQRKHATTLQSSLVKKVDKYLDNTEHELVSSYVKELIANEDFDDYGDSSTLLEPDREAVIEHIMGNTEDMHLFLTSMLDNNNISNELPDVPTTPSPNLENLKTVVTNPKL